MSSASAPQRSGALAADLGMHRGAAVIELSPRRLDPAALGDHLDRLYRAALAMCGSREDAEDLVQETYASLLARPRFVQRDGDLAYLLGALRKTFLAKLRTARRRPSIWAVGDDLEALGGARSPQDELRAARDVLAAITALPAEFRDVIAAVDVAGLSYRETARTLRIREGTVRSRLFRARQSIADQLG